MINELAIAILVLLCGLAVATFLRMKRVQFNTDAADDIERRKKLR
jgi:hypothetical protein